MYKWKYKERQDIKKLKIKNNLKIRVVPIDGKKRKSCLRWFDNMQRRAIDTPMKKSDWIQFK